jgi:CDP-diglyceride synthetase
MLFRLLKLAGIDVNAKIAELKADLSVKIGQTSEELTRKARIIGLAAGLFLSAALLALMVLVVALIAIYKWGELNYGAFVGLALVAGVLIVLAIVLVGSGLVIGKQSSKSTPLAPFIEATSGGTAHLAPTPAALHERCPAVG